MDETKDNNSSTSETPPVLKTWPQVYIVVLLVNALVIVLFYLITITFNH